MEVRTANSSCCYLPAVSQFSSTDIYHAMPYQGAVSVKITLAQRPRVVAPWEQGPSCLGGEDF